MAGKIKKGIILAGGCGSRLYPLTEIACKQLLPVYDKPMIYYPLSTLMQCGIREILIISTPLHIPQFEKLFGDGSRLGLEISYAIQEKPEGIAQAFIIGEKFIGDQPVTLILGDNIFYGVDNFADQYEDYEGGALIFGYYMKDPRRYGVIEFDNNGQPVSIEEKPGRPKSNYAVTGLYVYDSRVIEIAGSLRPSGRGELEITDINNAYLRTGELKACLLGRGVAWLDTGTFDSLMAAGNFIATIEKRQGVKIGCIEEVSYRMGFISFDEFGKLAETTAENEYREYLMEIVKEAENAK